MRARGRRTRWRSTVRPRELRVGRARGADPLLSVGITSADWIHMGDELDLRERAARECVRVVSLKQWTRVSAGDPLGEEAELVLVLAVNPGWGGQGFLPGTERRLEQAREIIERSGRKVMLGVDGGITRDNVGAVARMGVD